MIEYPWLFAIGIWWMCGKGLGIPIKLTPDWKDATAEQRIGMVLGSVFHAVTGVVIVAMSFK